MDYHTLTEGDRVRLSAGPIDYQVDHVSSDRIILTPDDPEESTMEIVKDRGEWTLVNVNKINFQVTVVNPLPTSDLNLTYTLLNELDLEDLINLCQTDNRLLGICQSDEYWKDRLSTKFGKSIEGIFLSGPEQKPILEGDHSINEYIDVERRILNIQDHIMDEDHIDMLARDLYEAEMYKYVDELMYIMRITKNKQDRTKDFEDNLWGMLIYAIMSKEYPTECMKEYLSRGLFPKPGLFEDFINLWDVYDQDDYLELWSAILDTVKIPDRYVRFVFENSQSPILIELFESYGYH